MTNLIIIGGGNSITSFPTLFNDIVGHDVMTINYAYKFIKETPKYQISCDRLFWNNNIVEMSKLELYGCKLIQKDREFKTVKNAFNCDTNVLYTGKQKLSGVFALDYATQYLKYDKYFLFGYDFGFVDGKSHFYNIDHSGNGKSGAYYDKEGNVLEAVNDFDYFKDYDIKIVGESNIKSFDKIKYKEFKEIIKNGS